MKNRLLFPLLIVAFLAILTVSFQNCTGGKSRRSLEGTSQPVSYDSKIDDQTVYVGDSVTFSVVLSNSSASVRFQWFKDGSKLDMTANSLQLAAARLEDAGDYSVEILSEEFDPEIQSAHLTVLEKPADPVLPEFTKQPESKVLQVGERLVLEVAVTGFPQPGLQWKKNGMDLAHTDSQFVIDSVMPEDAGEYTVLATNKAGEVTSSVAQIVVQQTETFMIDHRTACVNGYCDVAIPGISPTPDPKKVELLCNERDYPYLVTYEVRNGRDYQRHCNADGTDCFTNFYRNNVVATLITCTNNVNLRKLAVICVENEKPNNNDRCD